MRNSLTFISAPSPLPKRARWKPRAQTCAQMSQSRRAFLLSTLLPLPTLALTPRSSGEMHAELSELASKIPGAGMPDVYYPSFFLGDWFVTRELYAVERPAPLNIVGHATLSEAAITSVRSRIGRRLSYVIRFVRHRGHIIEERVMNERAELLAVRGHGNVGVIWNRDVPNIMTLDWGGGGREVKVTKRAFVDGPQGYGTFIASELAKVVDVWGSNVPSVYGRRRIVRYKVSSVDGGFEPDGMDRIVVEYYYPPEGGKEAVVLKFRDFLNRKGIGG